MKKFCALFILLLFCFGFTFAQENKSLEILEFPFPEIKKEKRNLDFQGTITLRVEFLDSGEIGEITVVSDISVDFIDDLIAAAKQIKFNPKIEGGISVTSYKDFQYSFSWGQDWSNLPLNKTNKSDDLKPLPEIGERPAIGEKTKAPIFVPKDRSLRILEKPRPAYPEGGRVCIQGTVTVRVVFLASGEIGEISPVSGLGYGLTEKAMEAAKKMKFEPAVKNGKPITVARPVQFNFTFY